VLVVRLSALGDVLFAAPAVQALADSGAVGHLTWLVEDRAAGLVDLLDGVDATLVFRRRRVAAWPRHAARLAARRDDLVLDLQGSLKSRLQLLGLRRVPRRVGYAPPLARDGAQRALTEQVLPPARALHRVAQGLALVAALGVPLPAAPRRPRLRLPAEAMAQAAAIAGSFPGDGPLIVLHPGTSAFGQFKRWAPAQFAELGVRLQREAGARLAVSGTAAEGPLVAEVLARLHAADVSARPLPPVALAGFAALLQEADLLVAADSFPLHLANALGTAALGLYGPKDPAVTGPFFDRARVVRAGVACSPCTLRRCHDCICMERLSADLAFSASAELLRAGRAR